MKHYDSIEHSTDVKIHEEFGVVNNTTQSFMPNNNILLMWKQMKRL
jgi:hypothetical protein